jgi:hypothetical protein
MRRKSRRDDPARQAYSVEETRRIIGVGASTIRRRIADGNIPIVGGLGKIKRVPRWWVDKQVGPKDPSE